MSESKCFTQILSLLCPSPQFSDMVVILKTPSILLGTFLVRILKFPPNSETFLQIVSMLNESLSFVFYPVIWYIYVCVYICISIREIH